MQAFYELKLHVSFFFFSIFAVLSFHVALMVTVIRLEVNDMNDTIFTIPSSCHHVCGSQMIANEDDELNKPADIITC